MKTPYEKLKRDNQSLHGFGSSDLDKFIDLAQISNGMTILDGMCGNGVLSKRIIEKGYDVDLHLLDNSQFQINLAKEEVQGVSFSTNSILETPFDDKKFDRVFIRNGIYEIPKDQKIDLYKEVCRILKNGGQFLFWAPKLNEENQKVFQSIIRKKDKIAGFDGLVQNRYLATTNEIKSNLEKAGFERIDFSSLDIRYTFSTKKWFEIDFEGDEKKRQKLNDYIREVKEEVKGIEIKDLGEEIQVIVPAVTAVAVK